MLSRCGTTLAVGAKCNVKVAFAPQSRGLKYAQLAVVFTLREGSGWYTKNLRGEGVAASFTLQPASLWFGRYRVGSTSPEMTVTVSNTGASVLPLLSIALGGTNPRQFARTHNCPYFVPAGGRCSVAVTFSPTFPGPMSATLTVWAGGGAGKKSIALHGTGE